MLSFYLYLFVIVIILRIIYATGAWTAFNQYMKRRKERKFALQKAKNFLKPYKKIFGDFCLSNQHCSVTFIASGTIYTLERKPNEFGQRKSFIAGDFAVFNIDDVWNSLCQRFNYNTKYEDVLNHCSTKCFYIKEELTGKNNAPCALPQNSETKEPQQVTNTTLNVKTQKDQIEKIDHLTPCEKLDVNSCSEAELMVLPGVTAIGAKKIIKMREEQGAFSSVDDFIKKMKIKPHFELQIRKIITAEPIKSKKKAKASKARIIDI